MKINIIKIVTSIFFGSVLILTGCASNGPNEKVNTSNKTPYQLSVDARPDSKAADTGTPSGNLITLGIAGLYQKTIELDNQYQTKLENSKVASTLEAVRQEKGEEAWRNEVNALTGSDKEEYDTFMANQVNTLAVALEYSVEAAKLALGIYAFDYRAYISNPFAIPATVQAVLLATEQITTTKEILGYMLEARDSYQAMLDYQGR